MLKNGAWKQMAQLNTGRQEFSGTVWNGMWWVFGAHYTNPNGGQNKVEYYDPSTDTWTQGPDLNNRRGATAAVTGPLLM